MQTSDFHSLDGDVYCLMNKAGAARRCAAHPPPAFLSASPRCSL